VITSIKNLAGCITKNDARLTLRSIGTGRAGLELQLIIQTAYSDAPKVKEWTPTPTAGMYSTVDVLASGKQPCAKCLQDLIASGDVSTDSALSLIEALTDAVRP